MCASCAILFMIRPKLNRHIFGKMSINKSKRSSIDETPSTKIGRVAQPPSRRNAKPYFNLASKLFSSFVSSFGSLSPNFW